MPNHYTQNNPAANPQPQFVANMANIVQRPGAETPENEEMRARAGERDGTDTDECCEKLISQASLRFGGEGLLGDYASDAAFAAAAIL